MLHRGADACNSGRQVCGRDLGDLHEKRDSEPCRYSACLDLESSWPTTKKRNKCITNTIDPKMVSMWGLQEVAALSSNEQTLTAGSTLSASPPVFQSPKTFLEVPKPLQLFLLALRQQPLHQTPCNRSVHRFGQSPPPSPPRHSRIALDVHDQDAGGLDHLHLQLRRRPLPPVSPTPCAAPRRPRPLSPPQHIPSPGDGADDGIETPVVAPSRRGGVAFAGSLAIDNPAASGAALMEVSRGRGPQQFQKPAHHVFLAVVFQGGGGQGSIGICLVSR